MGRIGDYGGSIGCNEPGIVDWGWWIGIKALGLWMVVERNKEIGMVIN